MGAIARRLSRDPVVWRNALAALLLAGVQVGLFTSDQADQVDGWLKTALPAATFLLPIIAGFLARRRTAPVAAGTPAVRLLARNAEGVYEPAGPTQQVAADRAARTITR